MDTASWFTVILKRGESVKTVNGFIITFSATWLQPPSPVMLPFWWGFISSAAESCLILCGVLKSSCLSWQWELLKDTVFFFSLWCLEQLGLHRRHSPNHQRPSSSSPSLISAQYLLRWGSSWLPWVPPQQKKKPATKKNKLMTWPQVWRHTPFPFSSTLHFTR